MRKILFSRESECIQPIRRLIEDQKHRTLVMWLFDYAPRVLEIYEKEFPKDHRPRQALEIAKAWSKGKVKMSVAKKAILATHKAAREAEEIPWAQAAARAIGHAAATVHVETHALGLVFYGLTAFIYAEGMENYDMIVNRECNILYQRLIYWQENIDMVDRSWAEFLLRDDMPNKENLLKEKNEMKE
jgi:hypothetical protein